MEEERQSWQLLGKTPSISKLGLDNCLTKFVRGDIKVLIAYVYKIMSQ